MTVSRENRKNDSDRIAWIIFIPFVALPGVAIIMSMIMLSVKMVSNIEHWLVMGYVENHGSLIVSFLYVGCIIIIGCNVFWNQWRQWKCPHNHTREISGGGYGHNDAIPWSADECLDCGAILSYG